ELFEVRLQSTEVQFLRKTVPRGSPGPLQMPRDSDALSATHTGAMAPPHVGRPAAKPTCSEGQKGEEVSGLEAQRASQGVSADINQPVDVIRSLDPGRPPAHGFRLRHGRPEG